MACLQDAEDIARIHMDAFSQDDEFLMAFPSATCPRSAQHAWHIAQITSVLNYHNTEQSWKKIIKAIESNSGQMVGWAEWNMGVAPVDSEEDEEWPDGANIEACRQFFGGMSRLRLQFMGQQRHFYTHLLAVDSSWY